MRKVWITSSLAVLAVLATASTAVAGPIDDFRRKGAIDPCRYSDRQLRNGLNGLPPDVLQYAPELADQLSAGREGCGGGTSGGGRAETRELEAVPVPGSVGGGGTGATRRAKAKVPAPPSPEAAERLRLAGLDAPTVTTAATGSDAPGWLAPLLAILAAGAALIAFLRVRGDSADGIVRPLRASFADAGGRTSDLAAEVWDSLRMGRGA